MIVSALIVAVVIMVAIVIKFRPGTGTAGGPVTPSPTATQSVAASRSAGAGPSADRSSSPAPSASSQTAGTSTTAQPPVHRCPDAEPTRATEHPSDGRVHGGALSFDAVAGHGFSKPGVVDHFYWWYDEHGQHAKITDNDSGSAWQQWIAAGTVAIQPGFQTPRQAARMSTKCAISAGDYRGYTGSKTADDQAVKLDGQDGWKVITEVNVSGRSAPGDQITVIVLNAGPPGSYSIFVGTAPLGENTRTKIISNAVAGLKVDG